MRVKQHTVLNRYALYFISFGSYSLLEWLICNNIKKLRSASAFFMTQILGGWQRWPNCNSISPSAKQWSFLRSLTAYLLSGGKTVYLGKASKSCEVMIWDCPSFFYLCFCCTNGDIWNDCCIVYESSSSPKLLSHACWSATHWIIFLGA